MIVTKYRLLTLFATIATSATIPATAQKGVEFKPQRVIAQRFPAIVDAKFIKGRKADIEDNELVLGVYLNGKARAYPINMLTRPTREIINDKLGGKAIAATW